ncbi:MAG: lipid-binding SYLF domain-containing protein [Candidatus Omnitrophica bacterium]|nr:lipid-binding SYLF domain-containing protein [Candidatus Omnitrophota bacterium]
MKRLLVCIASFFIIFSTIQPYAYAENAKLNMRIEECADLLDEVMQMPEISIPRDLLAKAKAIAIFPSVIKGGFIFGGRFGKGVALRRNRNTGEWSAPSFYTVAGGSWGLQIGGQLIDLILVITNDRGMKALLKDKFTLGGDIAGSAGPVGRNAEMSTDLMLKAGILSYSRSKGLFAGLTLKGAVVAPDNKANELYYGKAISAEDILIEHEVRPTPKAKELIKLLDKYSN